MLVLLVLVVVVVVCLLLLLALSASSKTDRSVQDLLFAPPLQENEVKKHVLVLCAHPDDECLFFGPTLLALLRHYRSEQIHLLCISTGNAEKIGHRRREEWTRVCQEIFQLTHYAIYDEPSLQDGDEWDPARIIDVLNAYFSKHPSIQTIITFDGRGVSGHHNHISCYHAALQWCSSKNHLHLFTLRSLPLPIKYVGWLGRPLFSLISGTEHEQGRHGTILSGVTSFHEWMLLQRAMRLHASQFVWFRQLYVLASSYMLYNVLDLMPSELTKNRNKKKKAL